MKMHIYDIKEGESFYFKRDSLFWYTTLHVLDDVILAVRSFDNFVEEFPRDYRVIFKSE